MINMTSTGNGLQAGEWSKLNSKVSAVYFGWVATQDEDPQSHQLSCFHIHLKYSKPEPHECGWIAFSGLCYVCMILICFTRLFTHLASYCVILFRKMCLNHQLCVSCPVSPIITGTSLFPFLNFYFYLWCSLAPILPHLVVLFVFRIHLHGGLLSLDTT